MLRESNRFILAKDPAPRPWTEKHRSLKPDVPQVRFRLCLDSTVFDPQTLVGTVSCLYMFHLMIMGCKEHLLTARLLAVVSPQLLMTFLCILNSLKA